MTAVMAMTPECRVLRPHLDFPTATGFDCTVVIRRDDVHHVWSAILDAAKFWKRSRYLLRRELIRPPIMRLPEAEASKLPPDYRDASFMRLTSREPPLILGTDEQYLDVTAIKNGVSVECAVSFVPQELDGQRVINADLEWIEVRDTTPIDQGVWSRIPYYGLRTSETDIAAA